jgi:hypothetical protein
MNIKQIRKFLLDNNIYVPLAGTKDWQNWSSRFTKLLKTKGYSDKQCRIMLQRLSTAKHSYKDANKRVVNCCESVINSSAKRFREMGLGGSKPRDSGPNRIKFH